MTKAEYDAFMQKIEEMMTELKAVHKQGMDELKKKLTKSFTDAQEASGKDAIHKYFLELDEFQLRHSSGTRQHKTCNPYMTESSTAQKTCALGLFKDMPSMVKKYLNCSCSLLGIQNYIPPVMEGC